MAEIRVKISSTDLSLSEQVIPVVWDGVLAVKKNKDVRNYTEEPKNDFVIPCSVLPVAWSGGGTSAFDLLIASESDCNTFDVSVESFCSGVWSEIWTGSFTSQKWKSDQVKKIIQVGPTESNPFDCLKDQWKLKKNIFAVAPSVFVRPYLLNYEHTEQTVQNTPLNAPCDNPPTVPYFCLYGYEAVPDIILDFVLCVYTYHRYKKPGTCSGSTPVAPDSWNPWVIVNDNCPTSSEWWACPEGSRLPFEFPNGRMLADVLEYLFLETGCGLTVKSDFFNINPDATAPSNIAYTQALAKMQYLVLFQKSDIKRHDATNASTESAWNLKLYDLLSDLKIMFNVDFEIIDSGTTFRIEHISYFAASIGNDYTSASYKKQLEQDNEDVPMLRKFLYKDEQCSDYFKGLPIEYYCGTDEKEERLQLISCDLEYITDDNQAEHIGDDGFVLVSTYEDGGNLYNYDNNRALSWSELHDNFFLHDMPGAGEINGSPVTPLSLKPVRKQPQFSVKHCCTDTFNAAELQTTSIGNGEVQQAEKDIVKETLKLQLKY